MEYQIFIHFQPTVFPVGGQPLRLAKLCRTMEAKSTIANQMVVNGVGSCVQGPVQFEAACGGVQQSMYFLGTTLYFAMVLAAGDFHTLMEKIW